jgi:ABC-type glucose/galactose transport system permease subunit
MKTFDIIYITLICVIVAVVLWAYWPEDIFGKFLDMFHLPPGLKGGNKKKKKRRKRRKTV